MRVMALRTIKEGFFYFLFEEMLQILTDHQSTFHVQKISERLGVNCFGDLVRSRWNIDEIFSSVIY